MFQVVPKIRFKLTVIPQYTKLKTMKPLQFNQSLLIGSDAEIFLNLGGKTIGSETVIPKEGLDCGVGKVVRDGIQVELNPKAEFCRAYHNNNIAKCFKDLRKTLIENFPKVKVDFSPLVKVARKEFDSLSEESKQFGCKPSSNTYTGESKIKVNPKKYLKRTGSGHLHWGIYGIENRLAINSSEKLVPMFDAILANTCVLIDRDKNNAERRKNYGLAGEFRYHENERLEYRTLSNFWLKSYPLASMVMGLGRFAVHLVAQTTKTNNYIKAIQDAVPAKKIIKAINSNNFDLAYENFSKLEPIILEASGTLKDSYPITNATIKEFHYFIKKGIDYWFRSHPLTHWCDEYTEGHQTGGFEFFLQNAVRQDIQNNLKSLPEKTIRDIWV